MVKGLSSLSSSFCQLAVSSRMQRSGEDHQDLAQDSSQVTTQWKYMSVSICE